MGTSRQRRSARRAKTRFGKSPRKLQPRSSKQGLTAGKVVKGIFWFHFISLALGITFAVILGP